MRAQDRRAGCNRVSLLSKVAMPGTEKRAYVPYSILPLGLAGAAVGNHIGGGDSGTLGGLGIGAVAGSAIEIGRMLSRRRKQLAEFDALPKRQLPQPTTLPDESPGRRRMRLSRTAERDTPLFSFPRYVGHTLLGGLGTSPLTTMYAGIENRRKKMLELMAADNLSPEDKERLAVLLSQDYAVQKRLSPKQAMPRGLLSIPQGADPAQMAAALQLLGQARALGTPTRDEVVRKGTSPSGYESSLKRMKGKKQLSDARTSPELNMAAGALPGAAIGYVGAGRDASTVKRIVNAIVGAGIGAGAGAVRARKVNSDVLATLKVLKDRGVLTPELLERAYPVLMTPSEGKSAQYQMMPMYPQPMWQQQQQQQPAPQEDEYEEPRPWWRKNWVLPAAIAAGGLGLGAYYGNRRGRVRGAEDTYDAFEKALTEQGQVLAGQ